VEAAGAPVAGGRPGRRLTATFNGLTPGLKRLSAAWVAAIALAAFIVAAVPRSAHVDFVAFYCAGQALTLRADPYRELPLGGCEQSVTSAGPFATAVTVPAPLPPYALIPFAVLSLVDFSTAFWLFAAASFVATSFACLICARLSRAPLLIVIALAAPTVWDNWLKGQPVPFAFFALALAGLLLTQGRERWAAVAALGTLVQPQIGVAVCAALFLWRPRARLTLALGFVVLAAASVAAVSPSTIGEYFANVLPLQAQSEARWVSQVSAVSLLVVLGLPVGAAMSIAIVQQAATAGAGAVLAGFVARENRAAELLVFFPALCAAIGGTYEHENALLIVLPAGLVIARIAGGRAAYVVLCAALMQWLSIGNDVAAVVVSLSLFTVAFVLGVRWPVALIAPAACAALSVVARNVGAPGAVHGLIPVVARDYAEISWSIFVAALNPADPVLRAALVLKAATWIGLLALPVLAVRAARRGGAASTW
jgi:hypothetical protein